MSIVLAALCSVEREFPLASSTGQADAWPIQSGFRGRSMSAQLSKARSKLGSIKTLLKQEKLLSAVMALQEAVSIYLSTSLLKHEKSDFQRKLEEAVFLLSSDQQLKANYPLVLEYSPGGEKGLHDQLKEIFNELQVNVVDEAREQMNRLEEQKRDELSQARDMLAEEDIDKAEEVFQKLVEEFPEDQDLKIEISDSYLKVDLFQKSLEYLKEAHKNDPDSTYLFNKLGIVLRKAGKFEMAEKAYYEALKRDPNDEVLLFNLGRVYVDWQKWDKAVTAAQKALARNSYFSEARKLRDYARRRRTH